MTIVSVVFHPLLVASYVTCLLLYSTPELLPAIPVEASVQFLLLVFFMTAAMPGISIFLLRRFNYISDLELEKRGERLIPFAFILFYYVAASYLFMFELGMGYLFNLVMISVTLLILILILITTKFKISIHAAAVWSAAGYLTAIYASHGITVNWMYYTTIIAAGLTTVSRLYLQYHTPKEAWSGSFLGFSYSFLVFMSLG